MCVFTKDIFIIVSRGELERLKICKYHLKALSMPFKKKSHSESVKRRGVRAKSTIKNSKVHADITALLPIS